MKYQRSAGVMAEIKHRVGIRGSAHAFLAHCSTKWGVFMMSMKSCIETGMGQAYPNDVHIDFNEQS